MCRLRFALLVTRTTRKLRIQRSLRSKKSLSNTRRPAAARIVTLWMWAGRSRRRVMRPPCDNTRSKGKGKNDQEVSNREDYVWRATYFFLLFFSFFLSGQVARQ